MVDTAAREGFRSFFRLDPDTVRCPYPALAHLRDEAPVAWFDEVEAYVVTSYELIVEVLRQPELFSSRSLNGPVTERAMGAAMGELLAEDPEILELAQQAGSSGSAGPVLVTADPPLHTRQRALVNRAFSPASVRKLEPMIDDLVGSLIDGFVDRGEVELVSEFAGPLPMTVIAIALGVELDRMDDFKRWSDDTVAGFGKPAFEKDDLRSIIRASFELKGYFAKLIREREQDPRDDLLTQIVQSRIDGERLSDEEMIDMAIQFLVAGNETTTKVITMAMSYLARDPALADRLRAEPDLVAPLVEEVLRLEAPTAALFRTAVVDYELGGCKIPAGASVLLSYAAGSRDPEAFDAPDECLVDRTSTNPHLGFGHGVHFCLGAHLARAECRLGIQALLRRCGDIRLAIDDAAIPYDQSFTIHGIQRLPLTFRRR